MAEAQETQLHMCAQCGKGYKHRRNLTTHEQPHNGTLPLSCSVAYNDRRTFLALGDFDGDTSVSYRGLFVCLLKIPLAFGVICLRGEFFLNFFTDGFFADKFNGLLRSYEALHIPSCPVSVIGHRYILPYKCMAWSWYLAVNMQFYLISPILLSFLAFSSSMGLSLISIVGMAGIISAGVKESQYGGDLLTSRTDGGAYWNNVFIAPWCRVSTYCVGLMLGFILQRWNHKKMNKLIAALLWVLSLCIGILIVYITYTKYVPELEPWTTAKQSAYEALSRPVWALCVAWLVYACQSNCSGPLGDLLSWKGFVPLSRLTFMVFLIHPVILVFITYTRRSLVYISDFDMAYLFVGHVTVNYVAAFLFSLVIDFLFRNFRRIVQGKPLDTPF